MAPRRAVGNIKTCTPLNYNKLSVNDVLCPICRSILIEPVTLPCNHGFCSSCFNGTMENTDLVCPLCRIRIGSWLRTARKNKTLINEAFWKAINSRFPQQIYNKLNGVEESLNEKVSQVKNASPGEIKMEYQLEMQKQNEELKKKRQEEIKASEGYIRQLKIKEQFEEVVKEEKMRLDQEIAKKLALELNNPSTSSKKSGPLDKFIKNDKEFSCKVLKISKWESDDEETGLKPQNLQTMLNHLFLAKKKMPTVQKILKSEGGHESSDSIESECRYFKPIDHKMNLQSLSKVSPMKVQPKKPKKLSKPQIMSPRGLINFQPTNSSAFARLANIQSPRKRSPSPESTVPVKKSKKQLFKNNNSIAASPPFAGFEKSAIMTRNNLKRTNCDEAKLLQEQQDLEFARRLHNELNKPKSYPTRSRINKRNTNSKRQVTLDEILPTKCY